MDLIRDRTQKRFDYALQQNLESIETRIKIFNKNHSYNNRIVRNDLKKMRESRRKIIIGDLDNWELKWAARPVRATNTKTDVEEVIKLINPAPVRRKSMASLPPLPANKLSKELSISNPPSRSTTPINSNQDSYKTGFSTTRSDQTSLWSKTGFSAAPSDHTSLPFSTLPPIDTPCELDSSQVAAKLSSLVFNSTGDNKSKNAIKALGKWKMLSEVILSSKISEAGEQDDDTITTYSMMSRRPSIAATIDIGHFSDRQTPISRRNSDAFIKPDSSELFSRRNSNFGGRRVSFAGIEEGHVHGRRNSNIADASVTRSKRSVGARWRSLKRQSKRAQQSQEQKGSENRKISKMTSDGVIRKFIEFMFSKLKQKQEKKVIGSLDYLKECRYLRTS